MRYRLNKPDIWRVSIEDKTYDFDTYKEACLFVLEYYGKDTLKECWFEITRIENAERVVK